MAFAPGYIHDLVISYHSIDDQPLAEQGDGWVTMLVHKLKLLLGKRLGNPEVYSFKMEPQQAENTPITPELLQTLHNTAAILIVLSPGYVASSWCQPAPNDFLKLIQERIRSGSRVFVVESDRVERADRPPELRDLRGYQFWAASHEGHLPRQLFPYPAKHPAYDQRYYDRLNDVSYDLANTLRQLKALSEKNAQILSQPPKAVVLRQLDPRQAENRLKESIAAGEYDVFLCHNSQDKPTVKAIGEHLKERGIRPWLDEWEFRPGTDWQETLEQQIKHIKSVAVCIGPGGLGPWQNLEQKAFIRQFVQRQCPVIPVILPECQETPQIPVFLQGLMWVDFRKIDPDPLNQLIWRITGEREPQQVETRPTVFLADATDDLYDVWEELKRYLVRADIRVLPATYYSPEPLAFQQAVRADLAQSDLFVQLLSTFPGRRTPELPQGYIRRQYELACEAGKPIIQWRSPDVDLSHIQDAAHREFLLGETILAVGIEELKAAILRWLTPPTPAMSPLQNLDVLGSRLVFVDADINDTSLRDEICRVLEDLGVGYFIPLQSEKPSENREAFEQFVLHCDALMIVYGAVSPTWVSGQVLSVRKIASKREEPLRALAIYDGPPAQKPPVPVKIPGMAILQCRDRTNAETLRDFLETKI